MRNCASEVWSFGLRNGFNGFLRALPGDRALFAMIAASALHADCDTLWSEDMQQGMVLENRLRIVNPFGATSYNADAQYLTPPAACAILRYMVKYQTSAIDRTFSALADPTRRGVLLRLEQEPGLSVSELARPFSQKLPGMMKHLDVLSDAGLITRTKTGRTVSVHLSVGPMREAMEWLKRYERLWTVSIDRLVALVEEDGER